MQHFPSIASLWSVSNAALLVAAFMLRGTSFGLQCYRMNVAVVFLRLRMGIHGCMILLMFRCKKRNAGTNISLTNDSVV